MTKILPVVLSGGSGTRLWPLSREKYPKQLLPLVGEHSMLQATLLRLGGLADLAAPLLVCNEEHRFVVAEQLRTATKGDPVAVSGEGRQRRWTDDTGTEQFSYQFVGHETVWHPRAPSAASPLADKVRRHASGVAASVAR